MGLNPPKILVIDDEDRSRALIDGIFAPLGFEVIAASDGYQALELMDTVTPDLVLLDIMMPKMNGFQVCAAIKSNPLTHDIPVIFLTAKTDKESLVEAFGCGAADYIQKPFNLSEVVARVQTHINLRQAHANLKIANATKDKFFLIISHDLKNPFNSILMNSNLLKSRYSKLDEEMRLKLVNGIQSSVEQTYNLLENLLEWSKKQLGKLEINQNSIDLHEISQAVITLFSGPAEDKNLKISNEIPVGTIAYADSSMITLVFRNLVSNAIKFSKEGGNIRLSCQEMDYFWEINVSDEGIGIASEDIQRLFKLDVHYTTYGTKNEKGAGLGLILSQEFIKENGGEIRVKSIPNHRTELIFTLPKIKMILKAL
ncbi:hybrid sensor histidine kinase/response regulator [bacterium]|nr:hybrid sensor histidine kinase/response regulator [bacterium]